MTESSRKRAINPKACPCCGGPSIGGPTMKGGKVKCTQCGLTMYGRTAYEAEAKWNMRQGVSYVDCAKANHRALATLDLDRLQNCTHSGRIIAYKTIDHDYQDRCMDCGLFLEEPVGES